MRHLLVIGIALLCVIAWAEEEAETTISHKVVPQLELGASVGSPAGLQGVVGYWGPERMPIVARAWAGGSGFSAGAGGEVGWIFQRNDELKQYIAVGGGYGSGILPWTLQWAEGGGGGVTYGLNYRGFSVSAGAYYASVRSGWFIFDAGTTTGIIPVAQFGYSWFVDL